MDIKIITLSSDKITDWDTFHAIFQEVFGFSGFYGRNVDAWNDCMTYRDDPDSGMSSVMVAKGRLVVICSISSIPGSPMDRVGDSGS